MYTDGLEETLAAIARLSLRLQDTWWVIGSAAIALAGADIEVPGVDLLVSERDARDLLTDWASPRVTDDGHDRFRSLVGEHTGTPIPIVVMGGLEVSVDGVWLPVTPTTHMPVELTGGTVFIPDATDQLALLLMFRRPQDLVRAEVLMRSDRSNSSGCADRSADCT